VKEMECKLKEEILGIAEKEEGDSERRYAQTE